MDTVGVRELRQNLSVYLRRVRDGETLRVTERGEPVAVLAPLPDRANAFDRLVAEGRLTPPAHAVADLGAPLDTPTEPSVSDALSEQRRE